MITKELTEAAVEINSILENLSDDILEKIPLNIKEFFRKIASSSYKFEYNKSKKLTEQNLKNKTKGILAFLYRDYISDEAGKQEFVRKYNIFLDKQEQIKRDKYNPEDLFKLKKSEKQYKEVLPIVYNKKKKWRTKILDFLKKIF